MIIPAVLNIKKGDFTATHTFYYYYSAHNSILQLIYETLYLFLAFRDDCEHFLVQYL